MMFYLKIFAEVDGGRHDREVGPQGLVGGVEEAEAGGQVGLHHLQVPPEDQQGDHEDLQLSINQKCKE